MKTLNFLHLLLTSRIKRTIIISCLLLCSTITYANITASIDRNNIASDETFTLFVTSDSVLNQINPDLSALNKNFEVVGTSTSSSVNIINGKSTSKQQLMITLMPKHTGHLVIPALTIGKETTKPLYINVKPPLKLHHSQQNVFVETSLNKQTTYPNVQNIYTIKLFYNLNGLSGNLSLPSAQGLRFAPLGKQAEYTVHRHGKNYRVVERRYAVFADKPGTYKISGVSFNGQMASGNTAFFQLTNGKPVHATSKTTTLTVKPVPAHQGDWLPARNLTITSQWSPNPPSFQVGTPVTRTIIVKATGLTAQQLPDLQMPNLTQMNSYPDQPIMRTVTKGNYIEGMKVFKVAYIPTQTGNITFPAITLRWWNTKTNQFQTATLPAKQFTIMPGKNPAAQQTAVSPTQLTQPQATTQPIKPPRHYDIWTWLAGLFFLIWIGTLIYFWYQKKQRVKIKNSDHSSARKIRQQLKQACEANDALLIKQCLLRWARLTWPTKTILTLGELAQQNMLAELQQAIKTLDKILYKQTDKQVNGQILWQAFINNEQQRPQKPGSNTPLPPLHLE